MNDILWCLSVCSYIECCETSVEKVISSYHLYCSSWKEWFPDNLLKFVKQMQLVIEKPERVKFSLLRLFHGRKPTMGKYRWVYIEKYTPYRHLWLLQSPENGNSYQKCKINASLLKKKSFTKPTIRHFLLFNNVFWKMSVY